MIEELLHTYSGNSTYLTKHNLSESEWIPWLYAVVRVVSNLNSTSFKDDTSHLSGFKASTNRYLFAEY